MTTQQIGRLSVKQLKLSNMAFKWNINPSGTNIYVDKDGNDSTGSGTSSNPYKSIAKATSVGTSGNNIILGNGVWSEQRTLNGKVLNWWGNGMTEINGSSIAMTFYQCTCNFLTIKSFIGTYAVNIINFSYCSIYDVSIPYAMGSGFSNCIIVNCNGSSSAGSVFKNPAKNSIFINTTITNLNPTVTNYVKNNIFINSTYGNINQFTDYNNYTTGTIPTSANCIALPNLS